MKPKVPLIRYDASSLLDSCIDISGWNSFADDWLLSDNFDNKEDEMIQDNMLYLVDIDLILVQDTLIHY